MSLCVPHIGVDDEHNWQRHNISPSHGALAEARATLRVEAADKWSFRAATIHVDEQDKGSLVYTFFFKEQSDVVVLRKFKPTDSGRSR